MKRERSGNAGKASTVIPIRPDDNTAPKIKQVRSLLARVISLMDQIEVAEGKPADAQDAAAIARWLLDARRALGLFFPPSLFGDPAFELLLDLYLANHEGKKVCVSSACLASGVPSTTALRWIAILHAQQFVTRESDPDDGRRVFLSLTPRAQEAVALWLRKLSRRLPVLGNGSD